MARIGGVVWIEEADLIVEEENNCSCYRTSTPNPNEKRAKGLQNRPLGCKGIMAAFWDAKKSLLEIRMDKNSCNTDRNKSHSAPPKAVIQEVIRLIDSIDRKIEEFYAIHGTDLQMSRDNRPNSRREK